MKFFLCLVIQYLFIGCHVNSTDSFMKITGTLSGQPNGRLYILNSRNEVLDSSITKNGSFSFIIPMKNPSKYCYVTLEHFDSVNTKRLFQFRTNRTYRGQPWLSQYFILEENVQIKGDLLEFIPKDFKLPSNIKLGLSFRINNRGVSKYGND